MHKRIGRSEFIWRFCVSCRYLANILDFIPGITTFLWLCAIIPASSPAGYHRIIYLSSRSTGRSLAKLHMLIERESPLLMLSFWGGKFESTSLCVLLGPSTRVFGEHYRQSKSEQNLKSNRGQQAHQHCYATDISTMNSIQHTGVSRKLYYASFQQLIDEHYCSWIFGLPTARTYEPTWQSSTRIPYCSLTSSTTTKSLRNHLLCPFTLSMVLYATANSRQPSYASCYNGLTKTASRQSLGWPRLELMILLECQADFCLSTPSQP